MPSSRIAEAVANAFLEAMRQIREAPSITNPAQTKIVAIYHDTKILHWNGATWDVHAPYVHGPGVTLDVWAEDVAIRATHAVAKAIGKILPAPDDPDA